MNCWQCDRPAHGVCIFCGRGICREHAKTMPHIISTYGNTPSLKAIVVDDALYCGVCKPKDDPVELEGI